MRHRWIALCIVTSSFLNIGDSRADSEQPLSEGDRQHLVRSAGQLVTFKGAYGSHPWQLVDSERLFNTYLAELKKRNLGRGSHIEDLDSYQSEFSNEYLDRNLAPVYDVYAGKKGSGSSLAEADKNMAVFMLITSMAGMQYSKNVFTINGMEYSIGGRRENSHSKPSESSVVENFGIVRPMYSADIQNSLYPATSYIEKQLKEFRASKVKALIIDVRGHEGFGFSDMLALAGLFIGKTPAVQIKEGDGRLTLQETLGKKLWDAPVAILVDERTGSGAEAFAAIMRDQGRAVVIGQRTMGDMKIRNGFSLSDPRDKKRYSAAMTLVIAMLFRLDGRPIDGVGVEPDIWLGPASSMAVDANKLERIAPAPGFKPVSRIVPASVDPSALSCPPADPSGDPCLQKAIEAFKQALAGSVRE